MSVVCSKCGVKIEIDESKLNAFERAILYKQQQGEPTLCSRCWLSSNICPYMSTVNDDRLIEVDCIKQRCAIWRTCKR